MEEISRTFRAMNTEVLAIVVADPRTRPQAEAALSAVEALFGRVEAAISRFRPESELSQLNRSAGRPFRASPLLFEVVAEAVAAARATGGIFDPTVLGPLVAAGYDRSFELLGGAPGERQTRSVANTPCRWDEVRLDARSGMILLPAGCGLDLGGIGKGWTVDQAVALLRHFESFVVDAGGDLYASGRQGDGSPWTVGVEDPFATERDLTVLAVRDRAVATSTVARRRWWHQGREQHHLIDPRTGRPADSGVVAATVVADSVAAAETLTKVALMLGPGKGIRFLSDQPDAEGLLVLADGRMERTRGLREVQYVA